MKRLIVRWKDSHTNIAVDLIVREGDVIWAYLAGELVGFFDLGCVDALYLTNQKGGN